MPLRLKQLDLHGYKTFATKSEFVFGSGISAIVGPNGSGKSNIVDSIRWVLGEQSFGLLRGKKTEDMIFGGSEQRPRAGMAEATLTFDNADGWLAIDFAEVSITRRAYRDGENEYLLNGQRVRLRDISELLAKCGLAERTYTIIGQGLIDTALSLKAEERRALFEEAAGIGVYRHKREDALRKLEATQRNLDRVLDILTELKPRLRSLEKQSQRAREYNVVKADLHQVLKTWYGYHWHRAVEAVAQARAVAEQAAAELEAQQGQQDGLNEEVASLRARLAGLRAQLNTRRGEVDSLRAEWETLTRELAVADERVRSLAAQREAVLAEAGPLEVQLAEQNARAEAARAEVARLAGEADESKLKFESARSSLTDREARLAALRAAEAAARLRADEHEGRLAELRARRSQLAGRMEKLNAARAELRTALAQLEASETSARVLVSEANEHLNTVQAARAEAEARVSAQTEAVRAAETRLLDLSERAATAHAEVERLRARHEVLEQAHAELAGFGSGARHLLAQKFPTRGALADLLQVPAELETAITAALGQYLEALVVSGREAAETAIEVLGAANGRAALLPLGQIAAPEPLTAPEGDPGIVGVAARLLTVDESLRPIVNLLLGQVVVVRDRAAARRLSATSPPYPSPAVPGKDSVGATFVTLAGEVFHASGPVLASPTTTVVSNAS